MRIAETSIWCDAPRASGLSFVSHAHLPLHPRPSRLGGAAQPRAIATARTLALRTALGGKGPADRDVLTAPFARPFSLGRLRLELLPSGHVPGAAQLLIERAGRRVLYAGDVNPRRTRTVEPAQLRECDAILFDAPLARLVRSLPPREESEEALLFAVRRALDRGETPLLTGEPLGSAGEAAALLSEAGIRFRVHRQIAAVLRAYRRFDVPIATAPEKARPFSAASGAIERGEALIWPSGRPPPALAHLRKIEVALSDHGDLPSLVQFAKDAGARDVHLFASQLSDEVEGAFRARGLTVHVLRPPEQAPLFDS